MATATADTGFLVPINSGVSRGGAPGVPGRHGYAEWVGTGRPIAIPGMDGGAEDLVEAFEDEAARLAGDVADLWWTGGKNGMRAQIRDAMTEKLARVGADGHAARISGCHRAGEIELMPNGQLRPRPEYVCKQRRLCPWCARQEACRRARRLGGVMATANPRRLQFATLTMANTPMGELPAKEAAFWRSWDKLRRRKAWADGVRASSASMETTWNRDTQTYHVHLHVALEARDVWDGGFSWGAVQRDWEDLTGAVVVDFRPLAGVGGVLEATKYAAKLKARGDEQTTGGGLLDMPDEAFREWLSVFGRPHHKVWRTYGAWYGVAGAETDEEKEERQATLADSEATEPVARFGWDPAHPDSLVFLIRPYISTFADPWELFRSVAAAIEKHRQAMQAAALARSRRKARCDKSSEHRRMGEGDADDDADSAA